MTDESGVVIGKVVEGLYAPTADKYCGHAFVDLLHTTVGTNLLIVIRGQPKTAIVVKRPFHRPSYRSTPTQGETP